jgi:cytochrome c biogenesis protein ResB
MCDLRCFGHRDRAVVKVNDPLRLGGNDIYLLGNGYARGSP